METSQSKWFYMKSLNNSTKKGGWILHVLGNKATEKKGPKKTSFVL